MTQTVAGPCNRYCETVAEDVHAEWHTAYNRARVRYERAKAHHRARAARADRIARHTRIERAHITGMHALYRQRARARRSR